MIDYDVAIYRSGWVTYEETDDGNAVFTAHTYDGYTFENWTYRANTEEEETVISTDNPLILPLSERAGGIYRAHINGTLFTLTVQTAD